MAETARTRPRWWTGPDHPVWGWVWAMAALTGSAAAATLAVSWVEASVWHAVPGALGLAAAALAALRSPASLWAVFVALVAMQAARGPDGGPTALEDARDVLLGLAQAAFIGVLAHGPTRRGAAGGRP